MASVSSGVVNSAAIILIYTALFSWGQPVAQESWAKIHYGRINNIEVTSEKSATQLSESGEFLRYLEKHGGGQQMIPIDPGKHARP